jgi:hypothetical protein
MCRLATDSAVGRNRRGVAVAEDPGVGASSQYPPRSAVGTMPTTGRWRCKSPSSRRTESSGTRYAAVRSHQPIPVRRRRRRDVHEPDRD